ncbi:NUDIX hydrolase [Nocardiopsis coralliicola]
MLVRDAPGPAAGAGAVEVYMLRRAPSMPFAPGVYAFPGGRVDERDADPATDAVWAGPPPESWAHTLGTDVRTARALVCAAVRETFEESGVLLAGPSPDAVVADTRGAEWEADRAALIDRSLPFASMLRRRGLVLRADLLRAWAQWITPESESRRYDTRFFAALLPEGQQTRDVGGEADRVEWVRPKRAVEQWRDGALFMLAPTVSTCLDLDACGTAAGVMAQQRTIEPLLPRLEAVDGGLCIVAPDGTRYPMPQGRPSPPRAGGADSAVSSEGAASAAGASAGSRAAQRGAENGGVR